MARNEEKSQSMLHRYLRTKDEGSKRQRRPYLASLCDNLNEATKWRLQVLGDIRRFVSDIQNAGLDDTEVHELNEKINKLLRERGHWERRISELGGKKYTRSRKYGTDSGDDVIEHEGYFYFGEAKRLPGVKELLQRAANVQQGNEASKGDDDEASKRMDVFYFGYRDEVDAKLLEEEKIAEEEGLKQLQREWEEKHGLENKDKEESEDDWDTSYEQFIGKTIYTGSSEDMQSVVLQRRKLEALEQLQEHKKGGE